jgi:hypothetical protein
LPDFREVTNDCSDFRETQGNTAWQKRGAIREQGITAHIHHRCTVGPMGMPNRVNPISEQNDPFYAEYLEMESSILEIINQIESRLSLHALDDHDEPTATKALRVVAQARITVGKADAAAHGQIPIGDTDWCLESTIRDLKSALSTLNTD